MPGKRSFTSARLIIAPAIAGDHRDSHFRDDLEQAVVDRLAVPLQAVLAAEIAEQPALAAVLDRRLGEIGVHGGSTNADQHSEIMGVEAFRRTHVDRGIAAQALADEMGVDGGGGEHHRDRDPVPIDMFVGKE
jgi:hypothetical protein